MHRTSRLAGLVLSACVAGAFPARTLRAADAEPKDAGQAARIDLTGWESEDAKYSNPTEAQASDDGRQLKIAFKGGDKDKAVVCKACDKAKLSAKGTLRFRVANPNPKAVQITVAIKTGSNYAFHESERITVKPGGEEFQDVSIDLDGSTFKSQATDWKNTGAIADPGEVQSIQLGVYNEDSSGTLIVADLAIVPKP